MLLGDDAKMTWTLLVQGVKALRFDPTVHHRSTAATQQKRNDPAREKISNLLEARDKRRAWRRIAIKA